MACNSGPQSSTMGSYKDNCTVAGTDNPNDYSDSVIEASCSGGCWATDKTDANEGSSTCSACAGTCVNGCGPCSAECGPKGSCGQNCSGGCGDGCTDSCSSCTNSCTGCDSSCTGGCKETCSTACAEQCSGTCSMGCVGYCNHGCTSEEVNNLIENLHLSRIAESDDINVLKKIIFRLFENLKISTIYKNQDYINEFGDNTIAGLVNNWNEDKDGKMTFTLLLNKTFETIITNLNNLNQNRIDIDQNKMNPIKIWTTEIPDPNDFTKTKTIQLNTVDRDAALYWIECLKKIYELVAPIKDKKAPIKDKKKE